MQPPGLCFQNTLTCTDSGLRFLDVKKDASDEVVINLKGAFKLRSVSRLQSYRLLTVCRKLAYEGLFIFFRTISGCAKASTGG